MDFGANIVGVGALADPGALADVARHAEALGYHSVFVADHVVMPRTLESKYPYSRDGGFPYDPDRNWLDPMVALGYLAARTTTIRLGTSITVLPMRHPIITAKQIATADHLSNGRVIFGVGVGWMAEEFALLGASFHDRRTDEYLALMRTLWTQEARRRRGRGAHGSGRSERRVLPGGRRIPRARCPPDARRGAVASCRRPSSPARTR